VTHAGQGCSTAVELRRCDFEVQEKVGEIEIPYSFFNFSQNVNKPYQEMHGWRQLFRKAAGHNSAMLLEVTDIVEHFAYSVVQMSGMFKNAVLVQEKIGLYDGQNYGSIKWPDYCDWLVTYCSRKEFNDPSRTCTHQHEPSLHPRMSPKNPHTFKQSTFKVNNNVGEI